MKGISNNLTYISRDGLLEIEDQDGQVIRGKEAVADLKTEWRDGGMPISADSTMRDAFHLVLSMPQRTDPLSVQRAARDFAKREFSGFQYAMVLHTYETDPDLHPSRHPHVHLTVKAAGHDGIRLNPRKPDLQRWQEVSGLPERTPADIETKKSRYRDFTKGQDAWLLNQIACIPIAQFYLAKTQQNHSKLITDAEFRLYLSGQRRPQGQETATAWVKSCEKRFFQWFLEFPDVIEAGGFDCILGNPPYLMNRKISGRFGDPFLNWVKFAFAPAGAVDLVTYFLRRIFTLLKPGGSMALISTNTIAQGAAREGGLDIVVNQGGAINFAVRSQRWPGRAAVSVSLLAVFKGKWKGAYSLDGNMVDRITSYLDVQDSLGEPKALVENADKSFQGSIVLGLGFVLSQEEARLLIATTPKIGEVIFPYLNGDDLNGNPEQSASRYVINFFDWSEDKCKDEYPEAYAIVEARVKPERTRLDNQREFILRKPLPQRWWMYADKRPKLYATIADFERVLVIPLVSKYVTFVFVPRRQVFMHKLAVIAYESYSQFAVLQSNIHTFWAWRYSSTLGSSTINYAASHCFVTFPLPEVCTMGVALSDIGDRYHEHRRILMRQLWLGLTDIYNLFHARNLTPELVAKVSKKSTEEAVTGYRGLLKLRRLHQELDEAVLDAYRWRDIKLDHDFYEVETLPENDRVRYTISPSARKDVLSRLLALNHERAKAQQVVVQVADVTKEAPKKRRSSKKSQAMVPGLYPGEGGGSV
jgi:hypothetical protein